MNMVERKMAKVLASNWWVVLVRGLVAIAFGILTWLQPGISLASLVILFGAYSLVEGLFELFSAFSSKPHHEDWWVELLEGLLGISVGLITFFVPAVTTLALLFFIAAWAIARGVLQMVFAIRLRKEIEGEWLLVIGGLASVVFGGILITQPEAGALGLLWVVAFYALVFGGLLVALSLRLRRLKQHLFPA